MVRPSPVAGSAVTWFRSVCQFSRFLSPGINTTVYHCWPSPFYKSQTRSSEQLPAAPEKVSKINFQNGRFLFSKQVYASVSAKPVSERGTPWNLRQSPRWRDQGTCSVRSAREVPGFHLDGAAWDFNTSWTFLKVSWFDQTFGLLETYLCSIQALPTLQSHISLTWIIEKILYAKYFDEKRCSICIPAPTLRKYWRQNILTKEILSVPTGSNTEKAGKAWNPYSEANLVFG